MIAEKENNESNRLEYYKGLNLYARDLRFAVFTQSKLLKADLRKAKLQGVNLGSAKLQGVDLKNAEIQNIFGKADIKTEADWGKVLKETLPEIPKSVNSRFIENINSAKERSKKFNKEQTLQLLEKGAVSFDDFITERNKLGCESHYIAKGLQRQYEDNKQQGKKYENLLKEHINKNCPEIAKQLK